MMGDMNPLVSIVVANYNYGSMLEASLLSVIEQMTDDIELIVVDGGSTDNSSEIIQRYADRISWWCSEKDRGQSDAFNKGFKHARGTFGCWLNADDILIPCSLKKVCDYLRTHPRVEWLGASSVFTDGNMAVKWCSRCVRALPWGQKLLPTGMVNGPSSFFRLDNLRRVGGFDVGLRYTMDTDLWRRFVQEGIRLYHIKDYVWCFRVHEECKTSHKFITGKGSNSFATEGERMNARYGITPRRSRLASRINQIMRLVSGTYLWSFLDTKRMKGKRIGEIFQ